VIHVWEDSNPIFHNALVHQYRELSQQLLVTSPEEAQKIRSKLLHFLETSSNYTPETVLVHFPYDCKYAVIMYPCFATRDILYVEFIS
jgi:hypothetical protein